MVIPQGLYGMKKAPGRGLLGALGYAGRLPMSPTT